MTTQEEIIEIIKKLGRFIFTSNKEYWWMIDWDRNQFFTSFGDTTTNTETERHPIAEADVLESIRKHYRDMKHPLVTDEEILATLRTYC